MKTQHAAANSSTASIEAPPFASLAGKYLTFFLGEETYGIPVLKVREIISMLPITQVPQVPAYMKGVINLRGTVLPIIDLAARKSQISPKRTSSPRRISAARSASNTSLAWRRSKAR